jgi:hypothetical protein
MPSTSLLNHIANFFLPSLFLAVSFGLMGAVVGRKHVTLRLFKGVSFLFLMGVCTQLGLVFYGFKDGSMAFYAVLCGGLALMHWLWTWRQ